MTEAARHQLQQQLRLQILHVTDNLRQALGGQRILRAKKPSFYFTTLSYTENSHNMPLLGDQLLNDDVAIV